MTKSFKEYYYLTESKNMYVFKLKLVGEQTPNCVSKLKEALNQYKIVSLSNGKRCPIQETQVDFPTQKNVNVTLYDVTLGYPITPTQLEAIVAETLNIPLYAIKVRSEKEHQEEELNHKNDTKMNKALLGTDYESENNQDIVGEKHLMSFLKELNKEKHQGTQYKGINDEILAKKLPVDNSISDNVKSDVKSLSPIGSTKIPKK